MNKTTEKMIKETTTVKNAARAIFRPAWRAAFLTLMMAFAATFAAFAEKGDVHVYMAPPLRLPSDVNPDDVELVLAAPQAVVDRGMAVLRGRWATFRAYAVYNEQIYEIALSWDVSVAHGSTRMGDPPGAYYGSAPGCSTLYTDRNESAAELTITASNSTLGLSESVTVRVLDGVVLYDNGTPGDSDDDVVYDRFIEAVWDVIEAETPDGNWKNEGSTHTLHLLTNIMQTENYWTQVYGYNLNFVLNGYNLTIDCSASDGMVYDYHGFFGIADDSGGELNLYKRGGGIHALVVSTGGRAKVSNVINGVNLSRGGEAVITGNVEGGISIGAGGGSVTVGGNVVGPITNETYYDEEIFGSGNISVGGNVTGFVLSYGVGANIRIHGNLVAHESPDYADIPMVQAGEGDEITIDGSITMGEGGEYIILRDEEWNWISLGPDDYSSIDANGYKVYTDGHSIVRVGNGLAAAAPPKLSNASYQDIPETGPAVRFQFEDVVTYYGLVYLSGNPAPDAATIKAQGTAVYKWESNPPIQTGTSTKSIYGLSPGTEYTCYVVAENAEGLSNVISVTFTTRATATISDGTVSGTVGTAITPVSFTVTVTGDTFNGGTWNFNLGATGLQGVLTATLGSTTGILTYSGTPTATLDEALSIGIPGTYMTSGNQLNVTANANAKYNIVVAADVTPPDVTDVFVSNETTNGATLNFTTDEAGKVYIMVDLTANAAPSVATVKAQNSGAYRNEHQVIGTGAKNHAATGLSPGTNYVFYFVMEDGTGNTTTLQSVAFTTLAALSSDASLISVAGQAINVTGGGDGSTTATYKTASITVPYSKTQILYADITAAANASHHISDASNFSIGYNLIDINVGVNHIYVRVLAEDGTTVCYYDIIVTRQSAQPTPVITFTVQAGNLTFTEGAIPSTGDALHVEATVSGVSSQVGLSYRWYSNASPTNSGGTLLNASGNNYRVPTTLTAGTYYYYCVASYAGAADVASEASTVTILPPAAIAVSGVTVSPTTVSLAPNTTQQLAATIAPSNATNKNVTWSSSNTAVATVSSSGLVTAVAAGAATITCTSAADNTKTATCAVTVQTIIPIVPVIGIAVSPTTVALTPNGTQQLTATISPSNATNKNVTWSSNNTAVATVSSSGLVTAVASGTAIITCTSVADNTKSATCMVIVNTTATEYVESEALKVYFSGNAVLRVESPQAETVTVYAITGAPLYTASKQAGAIEIPINVPQGVLLVRGGSGWTRKVLKL